MGTNATTVDKEIKSYFTEIPPNTAIFSCIGSRSWGEGRPDSDWNFVAIRLCSIDELARFATGRELFKNERSILKNGGTLLTIPIVSLPLAIKLQSPSILEALHTPMWVNPEIPELKMLVDMEDDLVFKGTREFKMGTYSKITSLYTRYSIKKDFKALADCVRIGTTYIMVVAGCSYREAMYIGGSTIELKTEKELKDLAVQTIRGVRSCRIPEQAVNREQEKNKATIAALIHESILKGVQLWH